MFVVGTGSEWSVRLEMEVVDPELFSNRIRKIYGPRAVELEQLL